MTVAVISVEPAGWAAVGRDTMTTMEPTGALFRSETAWSELVGLVWLIESTTSPTARPEDAATPLGLGNALMQTSLPSSRLNCTPKGELGVGFGRMNCIWAAVDGWPITVAVISAEPAG